MYARLLASLKYLHTVKFDCPMFFGDVPFNPFSKTIKWSGECGWCMSNIQDDADFQAAWVAKKHPPEVDLDALPKRPPSLRQVVWDLKWNDRAYDSWTLENNADLSSGEEDYFEVGTDVVS
jgi:hypothetical protein